MRFGLRVGFAVEGRLSATIHTDARLQQTENGSQVTCVLLLGREYITEIIKTGAVI